MPSLYNPVPYPPNTRRRYWEADFVASQPFCITSKLTDEEARMLEQFEEDRLFSNLDITDELCENPESVSVGTSKAPLDVKRIILLFLESLENEGKTLESEFGFCNTQTSGRVLPQNGINRKDFLNR